MLSAENVAGLVVDPGPRRCFQRPSQAVAGPILIEHFDVAICIVRRRYPVSPFLRSYTEVIRHNLHFGVDIHCVKFLLRTSVFQDRAAGKGA